MKERFERNVSEGNGTRDVLQIINLISKAQIMEIILFGIVGSTAMAIHYGIYYVLLPFLPVNVSFSLGYLISVLYNFTMSSYFTFKVKPSVSRFFRFATSHGTNYFLQILLLYFFIHVTGMNEKMAPVPVYAISVPVNYMLVRLAMKRNYEQQKRNNDIR